MSKINTVKKPSVKPSTLKTHEGASAKKISPIAQLHRSVLSTMLWEDNFYENGEDIATRIKSLVTKCKPVEVMQLAIYSRNQGKLRHAPLWLALALMKTANIANLLYEIIQRPDEITEFLAMYWKDGKKPIPYQVKKGLARAFTKFDAYQLAKYNRDSEITLRDVMFMVHAKPKDDKQAFIFKQLANKQLASPDTWEVALSGGADKKETFERLLREKKLGYMALLRNLRNMTQARVNELLVRNAILSGAAKSKALPFRFVAAARHAPQYEAELDLAMLRSLQEMDRLPGHTVLLVDVSSSMNGKISDKSDLTRVDAACALAALAAGVCEKVSVFSFSDSTVRIPPRNGMALIDAINKSQRHNGTALGEAVNEVQRLEEFDRMIVFTDEQAQTKVSAPHNTANYMINVSSDKNGVGYGEWFHIDGFSEAVIDYVREIETER